MIIKTNEDFYKLMHYIKTEKINPNNAYFSCDFLKFKVISFQTNFEHLEIFDIEITDIKYDYYVDVVINRFKILGRKNKLPIYYNNCFYCADNTLVSFSTDKEYVYLYDYINKQVTFNLFSNLYNVMLRKLIVCRSTENSEFINEVRKLEKNYLNLLKREYINE
jgi:hypothetical protein